MKTEIYSDTYRLNFSQCYANGKLKYSELSNLLQLVASDHAEQLGFGYREMAKYDQSWVLSRVRIEIDKLPSFLEEIRIYTWVQDFLGNRSIRNFEVYLENQKIITASSFWAVFNVKTRKSENLAINIDQKIIQPEKTATKHVFKRIELSEDISNIVNYTTKLSDLDIVNHVNNVKYTDWCLDVLPSKFVLKETFKTIDINYLKELKLGEDVKIGYAIRDTFIDFSINREEKTIFLMQISI
ncbi:acyl-[acyl-carrier-protein] thioesterase [Sphingobacterium sp. LRF_L2]|uniref:acyl-[acyl-carrier-protein] thioesterase n=1 Tax=Sphingobacterium sp. LRF_L2 TaxID=3369421 RepID=UPI003F5F6A17